jgi:tRNA(His) 5'-end guanylyltransferase
MAHSRFEYVRAYERDADGAAGGRLLPGCWCVVRLDGRGFTRFSRAHAFRKPNDARALRLMDAAAAEVMRAFPEVTLAYGQSDEYSFLLRRAGVPFQRRAAKLASLFASTFAAAYVRFWPEAFCGGVGTTASPLRWRRAARSQQEQQQQQQQQQQQPPRQQRRGQRRAAGEGDGDDDDDDDGDDGDDDDNEDGALAAIPLVTMDPEALETEERDAAEGRRAIARAAASRQGGPCPGAVAAPFVADADPAANAATPLRSTPAFDARCVEYPTARTVRDYFAWRQADAHVNNQYNTAFWALVQRLGLSPAGAQRALKGTGTGDKNQLMFECGINYNDLPQRYRKGSVICWEVVEEVPVAGDEEGGDAPVAAAGHRRRRRALALRHCDIIRDEFWDERPEILDEAGDAGDGSGRGASGRTRG